MKKDTNNSDNMKRTIIIIFLAIWSLYGFSQAPADTLQEKLTAIDGKINALDERVAVNESDLGKLTKIKISGYIQAQFVNYQDGLLKNNDANNTFFVRRARLKVTYQATDGLKFVLQPDFATGNLSLKDAYAVATLPKLRSLALWAGQFNRPNYEVEYSSSQREVMERSRVILNLYPGEREVGAKLEFTPVTVPLKLQVALLNGNFTFNQLNDVDSKKDLMARATYSLKFPGAGIGVDFGAHVYYGGLMAKNKYILNYENVLDSTSSNNGSYMDKKWGGAEMQVYFDVLGGLALKGEYLAGKNAYAGDSKSNPNKTKQFAGYYVYLIKNIGPKNQLVGRYDYFDPNTKLSGDAAGKDIYYKTLAVAWQFYLNENIRLSAQYAMPVNETNAANPKDIADNVFTLRMQAKF
jgi:phosphate-selective porin